MLRLRSSDRNDSKNAISCNSKLTHARPPSDITCLWGYIRNRQNESPSRLVWHILRNYTLPEQGHQSALAAKPIGCPSYVSLVNAEIEKQCIKKFGLPILLEDMTVL